MIDTTNLSVRLIKCPDGEVRQMIGMDEKDGTAEKATVLKKGGGCLSFKVEECEEVEK